MTSVQLQIFWLASIRVTELFGVRIRIVKQPPPVVVEGVSLRHYHLAGVYDATPLLANYLVAEGYAVIELRNEDSSRQTPPAIDRRRKR